jgi:hypothetical protein
MSIQALKCDNLVKLLDGLALLEDRDQDQIINIVNTLDFAYVYKEANKERKTYEKHMEHDRMGGCCGTDSRSGTNELRR